MMKKGLFILIAVVSFLFYSCGSTKTEAPEINELEPPVETEEVAQEAEEATGVPEALEGQKEETPEGVEETTQEEEPAAETEEDINILYPPLDEIEEPDLIELSPEEIEAQTAAEEKEAEENENQITEPIVEEEELPPLPITTTEDNADTVVPEALEGPTQDGSTEEQATNENPDEQSLEPTIEVQTEEEAEPEPEILPSRSVTLKKGETLVITYPGNGWIYMGSTSEYNNLASRGRKLGTTDTKYTLLAKDIGTQIHHFYKVDNLTGEYIDDYIEVTVLDKKGKSSTIVNAPDYSEIVPKKPETPAKASPKPAQKNQQKEEAASEEKPAQTNETTKKSSAQEQKQEQVQNEEETNEATSEDSVIEIESEDAVIIIDQEDEDPSQELEPLIEKARISVSSKKYDDAYPLLIQYLEISTDNRDEALYLLGQILESNSKYRDIKQAVETYQSLCDNYPASKYWDKANKRIIYLKRFYINIH